MTTIPEKIEPRLCSLQEGESKTGRFLVLLGWGLWLLSLVLPAMHGLGSPLDGGGGGGVGPLRYGIMCLVESLMMGWMHPWAWPILAAHILIFSTPRLMMRRQQPRMWVKASMLCVPPAAPISANLFSDVMLAGGWIWFISLVLVGGGFLLVCQQAESRAARSARSDSESLARKRRPPLKVAGLVLALLHLLVMIPLVFGLIAIPLITGPPAANTEIEVERQQFPPDAKADRNDR